MRPKSPTALMPSAALGSRVRTARKARGMSQADLADELGVGRRTIQAWEAGTNGISRRNLDGLLAALRVVEADLSGESAIEVPDDSGAAHAIRLARVEAKLDLLLRALGVDPDQATADGDGHGEGAEVITVSDAWVDRVVERMVAGFEASSPAFTGSRLLDR